MAQRTILVASYYFPPDAAVGALRAAKFVRFLPEFGWTPYVLTVQDALREGRVDPSRLEGLENVPVVRTRALPRIAEVYGGVKARLRNVRQRTEPSASNTPSAIAGNEPLSRRLKRFVISMFVYLPDERKNWSLYAVGPALRLIRKHRISCILTSGPPFSVHLIGLIAKAVTGARWIADFRDPWIDLLQDRLRDTRSNLSDRIERAMEAAVVRYADKVVTTTERMRDAMAARYPAVPGDRFLTVQNSIDSERLRVRGGVEKFEPFTITYAGALYFGRTPKPLFEAVGDLIRSGAIAERDIRVKLVGDCRLVDGIETRAIAATYGLERVVEMLGTVPYAEVVRIMQKSHLLLVLAPDCHRLVVPAKVFDYLGTGSTILALAEPGATSDLIRETQSGRCFSHADVSGLREYLHGLLRDRTRASTGQPEALARYDARHLTGELVSQALEILPPPACAITVRA